MKNILLFFAVLFLTITSYGQHISEYYTFKDTHKGIYGQRESNTSILTGKDSDDGEATIAIGFDFEFAGTVYDTLTIGVNGAITFTGTQVAFINQLDDISTNRSDIIAPLWDDMYQRIADDGLIDYRVAGSAPNRFLEIQWNVSWHDEGSIVMFTLSLYETTNDITFSYGDVAIEETGRSASIGLNAGTSGDNFISVTPGDTATISTSTANNSIQPSEFSNYTKFHKYEFKYGPHNDACEDAIVINPHGYSNTQIMNGTDNNDGFIVIDYDDAMNDGVWYTFTADYEGELTIDIAADEFDVKIAAFTSACNSFTCVGSADDNHGTTSPYLESLELDVENGTQYWINIGHYNRQVDVQETGNISINVIATPVNDLCENATEITCGDVLEGTNIGATSSGATSCGVESSDLGVWYHFAPSNGGGITAFWTTADFNTKLTIYEGDCSSLNCIGYNDDFNGNQPNLEIETLPETDYYVYVTGYHADYGTFNLNVACTTPVNDDITIDNTTISRGESNCYNANQTITVAGNGSVVNFKDGSSVNLIAGTSITLLPGFHAHEGSYVDAHITSNGTFCESLPSNIIALEPVAEKSVEGIFEQKEKEDQIINRPSLKVYPNPNNGLFTIQLENIKTTAQVMIFNSIGSLVHQSITNEKITTINLSNIQSGIYFIQINSNNNQFTQKVIIQ